MKIKVSVIVPIYNADKCLANCLGNLVNQTLKEIEIILVNDCSTDNSIRIINDCKEQFNDIIKIINFDINKGPGAARNAALDIASGEYIGFVDSDDIVDVTMYEKLYNEAVVNQYDMVDTGFYNEKQQVAILYTSDELKGILDDNKRSELIASGGYIWSKLFKKKYLDEFQLRFRNAYILEDSDFVTYAFSTAKSIGSIKEVLYQYSNRNDSLSSTTDVGRYVNSSLEAMKSIYEKEHNLDNYINIKSAVEYELTQMYLNSIIMLLLSAKEKSKSEIVDFTKEIAVLFELARTKQEVITGDYNNNIYVDRKMKKEDIQIMLLNDQNPEKLLFSIIEVK